MKQDFGVLAGLLVLLLLMAASPAAAEEMSRDEMAAKLKNTETRLQALESKIGGGKAFEGLGKWLQHVTLSGVIEVEAGYENLDHKDPAVDDEDASDLTLATAALGVDVDLVKHLGGHIVFLWEEDDTEPVEVDEGFIVLDGEDVVPLYLHAGRMYVPFGRFEGHFISDPLTLEIGETNQTAVRVGSAGDWGDVSLSVYNGDIDETGEDNHIGGFVAGAAFTLPEGMVPDFGLSVGASYISNIADSDGLEGETPGSIQEYVGGVGAFVSLSFMERFFVEAEYVSALDEFEPGELSFDSGQAMEPKAWNVEFAFAPIEPLELAIRYEGSEDLGDFLPETQYGIAASYGFLEYAAFSVEYLRGEFENEDERDLLTAQLAIEF